MTPADYGPDTGGDPDAGECEHCSQPATEEIGDCWYCESCADMVRDDLSTCPDCRGTGIGYPVDTNCRDCGGTGRRKHERDPDDYADYLRDLAWDRAHS